MNKTISVKTALVLCGGNGTRMNGADKSLIEYRGRTMISYALESAREAGVENLILKAHPKNEEGISREVKKYFDTFIITAKEPKKFRYVIKENVEYLDNPFYLLVGNQPMKKDYLQRLKSTMKESSDWAVSVYKINKECQTVVELEGKIIKPAKEVFILQHPAILTTEILEQQEKEDFRYTIEETIKNMIGIKNIAAAMADMPREFDDCQMLEAAKKFIDKCC